MPPYSHALAPQVLLTLIKPTLVYHVTLPDIGTPITWSASSAKMDKSLTKTLSAVFAQQLLLMLIRLDLVFLAMNLISGTKLHSPVSHALLKTIGTQPLKNANAALQDSISIKIK
jgi:hypothetical protein